MWLLQPNIPKIMESSHFDPSSEVGVSNISDALLDLEKHTKKKKSNKSKKKTHSAKSEEPDVAEHDEWFEQLCAKPNGTHTLDFQNIRTLVFFNIMGR